MATVSKPYEDCITSIPTSKFQQKWDIVSKIAAVSLAFIIPTSTALTHVALPLLMISWFLAGNLHAKAVFIFKHPMVQLVFAFFGLFLLGSLYSDAARDDIANALWKMSKLLYLPFLLPLMIDKKWRQFAWMALCAAMILTLILGFLKMYAGVTLITRHTLACTFKNHIDTSFMMVFATFLVGQFALQFLVQKRKNLFLASLGVVALMSFFVLWMSEGRVGYILFAALWGLFCLQHFSLRFLTVGIIALSALLLVVSLASPHFKQRLSEAVTDVQQYSQADNTSTSFGARLEYGVETWRLAKEKIFLGYGTGSFKEVYGEHARKNNLQQTVNPHNEYMNILLQLGLVGLAGFLALLIGPLILSFRLSLPERYLVQGLVVAMSIGSLANSWLMDVTSGYFFIMILGFCFGAIKLSAPLHYSQDLQESPNSSNLQKSPKEKGAT